MGLLQLDYTRQGPSVNLGSILQATVHLQNEKVMEWILGSSSNLRYTFNKCHIMDNCTGQNKTDFSNLVNIFCFTFTFQKDLRSFSIFLMYILLDILYLAKVSW